MIMEALGAQLALTIAIVHRQRRCAIDQVYLLLPDPEWVTACIQRYGAARCSCLRCSHDRECDDEQSGHECDGEGRSKPLGVQLHGLRRGVTVAYGVGPYPEGCGWGAAGSSVGVSSGAGAPGEASWAGAARVQERNMTFMVVE